MRGNLSWPNPTSWAVFHCCDGCRSLRSILTGRWHSVAALAVIDSQLQGIEPMTNRPKRQSEEHVIGREAVKILTSTLPSSWVVREYQPDYGIDLAIELFEQSGDADSRMNNAKKQYDALGEHLFVQVKGSRVLRSHEIRVKSRLNVERFEAAATGADSQTAGDRDAPL